MKTINDAEAVAGYIVSALVIIAILAVLAWVVVKHREKIVKMARESKLEPPKDWQQYARHLGGFVTVNFALWYFLTDYFWFAWSNFWGLILVDTAVIIVILWIGSTAKTYIDDKKKEKKEVSGWSIVLWIIVVIGTPTIVWKNWSPEVSAQWKNIKFAPPSSSDGVAGKQTANGDNKPSPAPSAPATNKSPDNNDTGYLPYNEETRQQATKIIRDAIGKENPADAEKLITIFEIESMHNQRRPDGTVYRDLQDGGAVGIAQIREKSHRPKAEKLGLNIDVMEDNVKYSLHLYKVDKARGRDGFTDWRATADKITVHTVNAPTSGNNWSNPIDTQGKMVIYRGLPSTEGACIGFRIKQDEKIIDVSCTGPAPPAIRSKEIRLQSLSETLPITVIVTVYKEKTQR